MIEFSLTITKTTRLFGGIEYVYLGNNLIKIPINKKLDYGNVIKLSNRNNIISNNFDEAEIYFRLIEQEGNKSRRNIYMGLPLLRKDLEEGTSVTISIKHKNFKVHIPAGSKEKNIIRLKNLVKNLYSDICGDVYLLLLRKEEVLTPKKKKKSKLKTQNLEPEILKEEEALLSEIEDKTVKEIIYGIYSDPSYKFSISIGFPYIIRLKFEKVIHGDRSIKRLK